MNSNIDTKSFRHRASISVAHNPYIRKRLPLLTRSAIELGLIRHIGEQLTSAELYTLMETYPEQYK